MPDRYVDILRYLRSGAARRLREKGVPSLFRPSQLRDVGLTPDHIPALIRYGTVERVCRGLYRIVDEEPTQHHALAVVSARSPGSIVCLHSALHVHGIRSRAPALLWLAIPHHARAPRLPDFPARIVRFSGTAWHFDVIWADFEGVPARITAPARTVVDCFRLGRVAGPNAGFEAFRDALKRRIVTIAELARVERILRSRRLRALLAAHAA